MTAESAQKVVNPLEREPQKSDQIDEPARASIRNYEVGDMCAEHRSLSSFREQVRSQSYGVANADGHARVLVIPPEESFAPAAKFSACAAVGAVNGATVSGPPFA